MSHGAGTARIEPDPPRAVAGVPPACACEQAATEFMERQRWSDQPCCPHCGDAGVYQMRDSRTGRRQANYRWRCRGCKRQYTVRTGTVMEDSRIPLRHWAYGFWAAASSPRGGSALQIKRQTGLSYKSALFLMHRIRFVVEPIHAGSRVMDSSEVDPTPAGETAVGEETLGEFVEVGDLSGYAMQRGCWLSPGSPSCAPVMAGWPGLGPGLKAGIGIGGALSRLRPGGGG